MEEHPFPDLKISNFDFLDDTDARRICPKCNKSRKYFCYTCYKPVIGTEQKIPHVKLPLQIDILRHPSECVGKSTASHAAVLAPDNVTVYTYPCIPNYDREKVVLVFPCENSQSLEAIQTECGEKVISADNQSKGNNAVDPDSTNQELSPLSTPASDRQSQKRKLEEQTTDGTVTKQRRIVKAPFDRVIFIDSTWNQTNRIYKDERLKGIRCVELKTRTTKFWRHQHDKPETYLSTIEAIYYFLIDYHELFLCDDYNGQYDNLLFFFCFMYHKIRGLYNGGHHLLAYKSKDKIDIANKNKNS